jgi:hypothetical protein
MTKALIGILAVVLTSSAAWANLANGDFENTTIVSQSTWTAGTDALSTWYGGAGWAITGSSGSKIADQTAYGAEGSASASQTLLQALPIAAGTYNWSLLTRNNDNNNLYGLVVLLAKDNAVINLTGTPFYPWLQSVPANTQEALRWDPEVEDNQQPGNPGSMMPTNGTWNSISDSFTISPSDASAYKYVVFVAEGDVSPGSLFSIDTESTDLPGTVVPEPMTLATVFMALGGLGAWVRRRVAKPQA